MFLILILVFICFDLILVMNLFNFGAYMIVLASILAI